MAALDLERILEFQKLLHAFARVERVAHITDRDIRENDAEHSYFMALMAWYIVDAFKLPLARDTVIRYALLHDLVEVHAGDTYILDTEAIKTKEAREAAALDKLKKDFIDFPALAETIETYEAQADEESRFVKRLDKIMPVFANYLQQGRTWKEGNVSFDEIVEHKRDKIPQDTEIRELLDEIIARIELQKETYFLR